MKQYLVRTLGNWKVLLMALLVNMVFNILIVVPWYMLGYEGAHAGLAIATSISAATNAYLLYKTLRKLGVYQPSPGWSRVWLQVVMANMVMLLVLWWGQHSLEHWLMWTTWERVMQLLSSIVLAMLAYFLSLFLLGVKIKTFLPSK